MLASPSALTALQDGSRSLPQRHSTLHARRIVDCGCLQLFYYWHSKMGAACEALEDCARMRRACVLHLARAMPGPRV